MRIEVRFQAPDTVPPPMQFQHPDPSSGDSQRSFGAMAESVGVGEFSTAAAGALAAPILVEAAERDPGDPSTWGKIGRNETCPCGSGKKFKHCHGMIG